MIQLSLFADPRPILPTFERLRDEYREKFTKLKDNLEKAKDGKRLFLSEDEAFELMAAI